MIANFFRVDLVNEGSQETVLDEIVRRAFWHGHGRG